jgi:hypothetical protein
MGQGHACWGTFMRSKTLEWPVPDRSRQHPTPRHSHEHRVRPQLFVFVTAVNRTTIEHPSSCGLNMGIHSTLAYQVDDSEH